MSKENKPFSFAALAAYGQSENTAAVALQNAFREDAKRYYLKAGCPQKEEFAIFDEIVPDLTKTTGAIPGFVTGFMKDEGRSFDLPAPDEQSADATISFIHKEEETKEGINTIGPKKGETWTSTTLEHDEISLKNRKNRFKKK